MLKNVKNEIVEFFQNNTNFTQKETYGMIVLIPMIVILPFSMIVWERTQTAQKVEKEIVEMQSKRADSLLAVLEMQQPLDRATKLAMLEIRSFNPNDLSVAEWQAMGVKSYLAKKIVNANSKGFVFRQKNDLAKIWGFPKEEYERLKPFIDLPDTVLRKNKYAKNNYKKNYSNQYKNDYPDSKENDYTSNYEKKEYKKYQPKVIQKFDINIADTATLKQIRGIGEKTSVRIEKFRKGVGGFHSVSQVKEVYGLSLEAFEELQKYAFISRDFQIKKVNVNTSDYQTLKKHSYINGKSASILLKYKKQHGNYKSVEELKKSRAFSDEELQKLIPYLEF